MTPAGYSRFFAAVLMGAASITAANAQVDLISTQNPDGIYAVYITTQHGDCDKSYQWKISVSGGRVSSAFLRLKVLVEWAWFGNRARATLPIAGWPNPESVFAQIRRPLVPRSWAHRAQTSWQANESPRLSKTRRGAHYRNGQSRPQRPAR